MRNKLLLGILFLLFTAMVAILTVSKKESNDGVLSPQRILNELAKQLNEAEPGSSEARRLSHLTQLRQLAA